MTVNLKKFKIMVFRNAGIIIKNSEKWMYYATVPIEVLWGHEKHERIKRIHTKVCKRVLGVSYSTSNIAVLGDCGRYPLFISYFTMNKMWAKTSEH